MKIRKNKENAAAARVKRVILGDKLSMPDGLIKVIKSDIYNLLNSYFEIDGDKLSVEIYFEEPEGYKIAVSATGNKPKRLKYLE